VAIHAVPRASRTEVAGLHGETLKVRLQAPPVDGQANRVLLDFLRRRLGLRSAQVRLLSGATGREKRVAIHGLPSAQVAARLLG
jgi:hypothetical protein